MMNWYYNLLLLIFCITGTVNLTRIIGGIIEFYFSIKNDKKFTAYVGFQCYILGASIAYIILYITKYTV